MYYWTNTNYYTNIYDYTNMYYYANMWYWIIHDVLPSTNICYSTIWFCDPEGIISRAPSLPHVSKKCPPQNHLLYIQRFQSVMNGFRDVQGWHIWSGIQGPSPPSPTTPDATHLWIWLWLWLRAMQGNARQVKVRQGNAMKCKAR